jgi:RNA polymerase sigma-70 factor (ECF subfamily)
LLLELADLKGNGAPAVTSEGLAVHSSEHGVSDEEVLGRVRAGELAQYEILVHRHHRRLYGLARKILRDHGEAEDAVQEVHVRVLTHLDQFAGRSSFQAWLTRIALNESLSRLRRRPPGPVLDISAVAQNREGVTLPSPGSDPEQQVIDRELRRTLQRALDALPENYRVVFTMREIQEMSTEESARLLGLSHQCVKTRLHRAKGLLRDKLHHRVKAAGPGHSWHASPYGCRRFHVLN